MSYPSEELGLLSTVDHLEVNATQATLLKRRQKCCEFVPSQHFFIIMLRIYVADPHDIMRGRLKALLSCVGDLEVTGQSSDVNEILTDVSEKNPDVLLLDPSLSPDGDMKLLQQIRHASPALKILVLTKRIDDLYRSRLMRAGADAYLAKTTGLSDLVDVIRMLGATVRKGRRDDRPSFAFGELAASS